MYMDEAMTIQIHAYACSVEPENSLWSVSALYIPEYKVLQWNVGWKAIWPGVWWYVCEFNCATSGNCRRSQSQSPWKPFVSNIWGLCGDKNYIYKWFNSNKFHLLPLGHWSIQREYRRPLGRAPIKLVEQEDPILWGKRRLWVESMC